MCLVSLRTLSRMGLVQYTVQCSSIGSIAATAVGCPAPVVFYHVLCWLFSLECEVTFFVVVYVDKALLSTLVSLKRLLRENGSSFRVRPEGSFVFLLLTLKVSSWYFGSPLPGFISLHSPSGRRRHRCVIIFSIHSLSPFHNWHFILRTRPGLLALSSRS